MKNEIPEKGDKIMTVDEVASVLRVHPFTVLSYIRRGLIDAAKFGRVYRIRASEIDRFFDCMITEARKSQPKKPRSKSKKIPRLKDEGVIIPRRKLKF